MVVEKHAEGSSRSNLTGSVWEGRTVVRGAVFEVKKKRFLFGIFGQPRATAITLVLIGCMSILAHDLGG
jgi:hypothetical protein